MSPKIVNFGRESNELLREMNIHAAAAYATHLLKARSTAGHGVHSPFMFSFITEVIGGRSDRAIQKEVEGLRREMLADSRVVGVKDLGAGSVVLSDKDPGAGSVVMKDRDLGAGSVVMKDRDLGAGSVVMKEREKSPRQDRSVSHKDHDRLRGGLTGAGGQGFQEGESENGGCQGDPQDAGMQVRKRKIRDIASVAAVPKREAALLARITWSLEKIRPWVTGQGSGAESEAVILELGTSLGISTLALALGDPYRKVISIEGCPQLAAIARENLQQHGAYNAEVMCMEFGEALAILRNRGTKVVLAFIDGNHRGQALIDYVHLIREMGDEMIIIADDIHMNRDMIQAWRSLLAGNLAPASLETFRMGMLFCLRNLTPGNYRVR